MSGNQPEPNPYSRDYGSGDGSEPNRFDTWADGSTPSAHPAPDFSAPEQSASTDPLYAPTPQPYGSAPEPTGSAASAASADFPTYPYDGQSAPQTGYSNPDLDDEAYAAFQGYQASTSNYPGQSVQPYQGYPTTGVYGAPVSPYGRLRPNSGYAVPGLVLGIIGVFCGITGPIGLGMGIAALRQIDAEPDRFGGRGLAIGAIITGAIGTLWVLIWILGTIAN